MPTLLDVYVVLNMNHLGDSSCIVSGNFSPHVRCSLKLIAVCVQ